MGTLYQTLSAGVVMAGEFLEAVKKGDAERVRALFQKDSSLANAQDQKGVSAVLLASYHGHKDLAELLASRKPDLNILEASATGKTSRISLLIRKDPASVNSYSSDGFTALHLAAFFGGAEAVRLLLENKAPVNAVAKNPMKVTPLHSALARNDLPVVELLVAHGADVNATQQNGYTPLHEAAQNGNLQAIILLLSHGAKINAKTEDGKTPLALTTIDSREAGSREDRERVAEFLRDHGGQ